MDDFLPCADGDGATDGNDDRVGAADVGNGLKLGGVDTVGGEVGWDDGTIAREGLSLGECDACSDGVDVGGNECDGVEVGVLDGFGEIGMDGLELGSCDCFVVAVGRYVGSLNDGSIVSPCEGILVDPINGDLVGGNVSDVNDGDHVGIRLDADIGAESSVLSVSHDKCDGGSSL